jgi:transposase-like protein
VARAARPAVIAEETVPLPEDWPGHVRAAFLHALGLVRAAVFFVRGWAENSPLPRARLQGENERLKSELLLAQQELQLKDARMSRLPPARRPHYAPVERLEILMLAAARGWSIAETARRFLVTSATIADWKNRCDENGADALVQVREPVNKFPDFVTALVQQCQVLVLVAGRRKIAEHFARAGLHLSASTIKRRLEARPVAPAPIPTPTVTPQSDGGVAPTQQAARTVVACHPHHVWGADLTLMPLGGGFAVPWWPFCCLPRWPFCWWVLLVVDHFSRTVVHVAVFSKQPTEAEVVAALEQAVPATGPPRHFVTDHGAQFQSAFSRLLPASWHPAALRRDWQVRLDCRGRTRQPHAQARRVLPLALALWQSRDAARTRAVVLLVQRAAAACVARWRDAGRGARGASARLR